MQSFNFIHEHYVTALKKDMNLYVDEAYKILVKAYAPIGGLLGVSSKEDLMKWSDLWKLVRKNNKIVAVCIYTTQRGGRKLTAAGSDGTEIGKQSLYNILKEDIKLRDRSAWAELSGAIEYKMIKFGAIPIKAKDAQLIIPDKKFHSIDPDEFHYTREIGGELHKKIMVGNISKLPLAKFVPK